MFFDYIFFFVFFFSPLISLLFLYIYVCRFFFFSILTFIAVKNPCFFSFLNSMLFLCCAPYMLAVSAFLPFSYPLSFSFRLLLLKIVFFFLVFCFPMLRYLLLPECRFFICSFAFFFFCCLFSTATTENKQSLVPIYCPSFFFLLFFLFFFMQSLSFNIWSTCSL